LKYILKCKELKMAKEKAPKPEAATEGEEGAEGVVKTKKKLSGKQLILFIALPAILLLGGGGGAAYYFLVMKKPPAAAHGAEKGDEKGKGEKGKDDKDAHGAKKDDKGGAAGGDDKNAIKSSLGPHGESFLTLPDILVNITTANQRPAFLKLRLTLQVKDAETAEAITPALPRIRDQYTGFLRELRMEDIAGSAGYSRLQLELLKRVNLAVAPAQVDAVLIEEMLVQ
jgi:flagellar FliL protein